MEAASALFLEGGLKALSVRAVAAKAGVSTIGIYSHFQGKQGVLDALYIEGFALVEATLRDDDATAPRNAVRAMVRRYLAMADRYQAHYWLIFGAESADYRPSGAAQDAAARAFGRLCQRAAAVAPAGSGPREVQRVALKLWALVHGFVALRRHAIARELPLELWEPLILEAVDGQIEALQRKARRAGGEE
ncbi:MAG: TetR family transcriptional regulator [Pseudomonadota bacterium]